MIKTGLVSATFRRLTAKDVLDLAVEAGLNGVEWSSDVHVPPGEREVAEQLSRMCREQNIAVCGYASYYRLGEQEDPMTCFRPILESANALKAPVIRIWAGDQPSETAGDRHFLKLAEEAALLVQEAGETGIGISFEYHQNTLNDTPRSALRLLESVAGSKTHWQTSPTCAEKENILAIRQLASYITTIHVQHHIDGVYHPLADGKDVWAQYVKELKALSGLHYACLEFVKNGTVEQFLEDGKILSQLVGEY